MKEKTGEEMFGAPVPGEAVRASELESADRREAAEAEQRLEACEGCGRIWRHSLSSGHGSKTRIQADGLYWHDSCFARRFNEAK